MVFGLLVDPVNEQKGLNTHLTMVPPAMAIASLEVSFLRSRVPFTSLQLENLIYN